MTGATPASPDEGRFTFTSKGWRYEVLRPLLEHVDHGTWWLAECRPTGGGPRRPVALRQVEVPAGPEGLVRAREEVQLAARLHHPGIARVLGLAEHRGGAYVVTEHTQGAFLATILGSAQLLGRSLSLGFAVFLTSEVAHTLDFAHRREDEQGRPLHILHRAVSPMTLRFGLNGRVKLAHFGAARSALPGRLRTPPRVLRGDLAYAAPERLASARVDGRADVFSLGLVLLEMIAGHHPLDPPDDLPPPVSRRTRQRVAGKRAEQSAWAPLEVLAERLLRFGPREVELRARRAPLPLREILHRALRAQPGARYPSAAALRDDLRDWLYGLPRPFGAPEAAAEWSELQRRASALEHVDAHPVERGVLPWPKAWSPS